MTDGMAYARSDARPVMPERRTGPSEPSEPSDPSAAGNAAVYTHEYEHQSKAQYKIGGGNEGNVLPVVRVITSRLECHFKLVVSLGAGIRQ